MASKPPRLTLGQLWTALANEWRRLKASRLHPRPWVSAGYVSTEDPIVVGGSGRSGTTLLSVILNSHPAVYCGPEYSLLLEDAFSLKNVASNLTLDPRQLKALVRQTNCRGHFLDRVMQLVKTREGTTCFATKDPIYTLHLRRLFEAYPNARFICMCRDGRDVCASVRANADQLGVRLDATFDPDGKPTVAHCARDWRTYINAFRPWEQDHRCYLLRYEELVKEPEDTLRDLCRFLGIPYCARLLEFHENGTRGRGDLDQPHLTGTRRPLYTDKQQQWRKALTAEQAREFEQYAGAELQHLGYPLEYPRRGDAALGSELGTQGGPVTCRR